jgi:dTDP-4-dehydrorhamnose reductase
LRILLTGATGQVGWELRKTLAPLGEVKAFDRFGLDLADPPPLVATVRALQPAVIVNAGAYTAVDKAESERDQAFAVNARAPRVLAEEAKRIGALLVHYSTDYVFDGGKAMAYAESDLPHPINAYGESKLAGEQAIATSGCRHLILRTSWVYGPRGRNFYLGMLRLAKERPELKVVDDQVGAPTSSLEIARATALLIGRGAEGLYHMTAAGSTTWCGFARAILKERASPRRWSAFAPRTTRRRRSGRATRGWTARGCARSSAWRSRHGRNSSPR